MDSTKHAKWLDSPNYKKPTPADKPPVRSSTEITLEEAVEIYRSRNSGGGSDPLTHFEGAMYYKVEGEGTDLVLGQMTSDRRVTRRWASLACLPSSKSQAEKTGPTDGPPPLQPFCSTATTARTDTPCDSR